jgi:hypothetical protein
MPAKPLTLVAGRYRADSGMMGDMTEPAGVPPQAEPADGDATTGRPSASQVVEGFARWVVWCALYTTIAVLLLCASILAFRLVGFTGGAAFAASAVVAVGGAWLGTDAVEARWLSRHPAKSR